MSARRLSLLIANGALVFGLGMIAGFPFAAVLLPEVTLHADTATSIVPGDVRGWRMAHLEGILNGLILIAVGAAGDRLRLGVRGEKVLFWSLVVTAWGNTVASIMGPLFGGRGLTFGGGVVNSVMFLLFMAAIVTVLIATWLVFVGALRGAPAAPEER